MEVNSNRVGLVHVQRSAGQMPLPGSDLLQQAVVRLSDAGIDERGAIFTRREVVEFILDLLGYTEDKQLHSRSLLEPSFGQGDFFLVATERLLKAYFKKGHKCPRIIEDLRDSIRGVELHAKSHQWTRTRLRELLQEFDVSPENSETLLDTWLIHGDFLLSDIPLKFAYVVGNPPYVRQELIPDVLLAEYRRRFDTIFDRADLYVPFTQKSLSLLAPGGSLGFICADRWMKNKYGGPLRKLVADRYHLKYYIDMVDTKAFLADVMAYPAIMVIKNEKPGPTRVTHRPSIDSASLKFLAFEILHANPTNENVTEVPRVPSGSEPWILHSFDQLALVRRLQSEFPTIEESGCTISIGVATGADKVFIRPYDKLEIEPDRKVPLVMTKDIEGGTVQWHGAGIINPFTNNGKLVDLRMYPKLAAYLRKNEQGLRNRHVAKQNPNSWYRTIDRIYPDLITKPKLLIPDIKGTANIVYEDGHLYPHHNLYYITSEKWELRALQAVLLSGIARLFVSIYSTRMRGGYLRFQAQYLRRIRLPRWEDVPKDMRLELARAAENRDIMGGNVVTSRLYNLSAKERAVIRENGE